MSGRGEPAGCHGDVLKGGLCARLSCAARIPAPAPHPPGRPVPLGPARPGPSDPAQSRERGSPGWSVLTPGIGILPGAVGCLWCGVGTGATAVGPGKWVIWGARMLLVLTGMRLLV